MNENNKLQDSCSGNGNLCVNFNENEVMNLWDNWLTESIKEASFDCHCSFLYDYVGKLLLYLECLDDGSSQYAENTYCFRRNIYSILRNSFDNDYYCDDKEMAACYDELTIEFDILEFSFNVSFKSDMLPIGDYRLKVPKGFKRSFNYSLNGDELKHFWGEAIAEALHIKEEDKNYELRY